MDPIEELKTKVDTALAKLDAIDVKIDTLLGSEDTADPMTPEAKAQYDALVSERKAEEANISKLQERITREQGKAKVRAELATLSVGPGRRTTPDSPSGNDRGFTVPATVKRWGSLKHFRSAHNGVEADARAYRFGMWGLSRLAATFPGVYTFPAANEFVQRHMAVHQSNNATGVQFVIPEEFTTDIINLKEMYGTARQIIGVTPMARETMHVPRRASGLTAYFVSEGVAATESNMTLNEVLLVAKEIACLTRISRQVDADAAINFGDFLVGEISYAFAYKEDLCAFNGDGTSTYGGIQGFRTKLDNCDGAGTDSAGLITATGHSTWATLTLQDFENVVGALPQYADTPSAAWVCHKKFYETVMKALALSVGWTDNIVNGVSQARFLGYPVKFSQVFPNATASGHIPVIFGDYSMAAKFGDRAGETIEFSNQATVGGESTFERRQIAILGTERFDVVVHDVGDASNAGPVVGLKTA